MALELFGHYGGNTLVTEFDLVDPRRPHACSSSSYTYLNAIASPHYNNCNYCKKLLSLSRGNHATTTFSRAFLYEFAM